MAFGTRSGLPYFPEYDEGMYPLIDPVTGRVHQAHTDNLAYPYSSYVSAMPSALDYLIQNSKRMDAVNRPMERIFPTQSRMTPDQLIKGQAGQTTKNVSSLSKAGTPVSLKKNPYDPLASLREPLPQPPRTEVPVDYSESLIGPPPRPSVERQQGPRGFTPEMAQRQRQQPERPFDFGGATTSSPGLLTTQPEEAQGFSLPSGLLDFDTDFYDDPQRMGLIQAGLGMLAQPTSSTDPAKVSLNQALAGGLAGYLQGYGGTKQRLTQAEKDKLDEEFKRSQMGMDQRYKESLIKQADALVRNYESQILERGKENVTLDREAMTAVMTLNKEYTVDELDGLPDEDFVSEYQAWKKTQRDLAKPETPQKPSEKERRGAILESVYNIDPETGERTINEEVLNSPLYRQAFIDYQSTLKVTASPNGTWTEYEKPQYEVPPGVITKIELAGPGQKRTDTGRFVRFQGMKDAQREKIDQAYIGINKIQNLQNKLEEYGVPNFMDRLISNDPQTRELMSDYYDLLLTLKNEGGYNLGVLTGNDEQIIKNVIADPTELSFGNNFNTIATFMASFNTTKRNLMDNIKPATSRYNIDPMQEYEQAGFTPLRFDPIQLAPVQQDSGNYDNNAVDSFLESFD